MTREVTEAIEYIKTYRKLDENLYNTATKGSVSFYATEKCLHYWDMAIKALEQQPCEDCISREAVDNYVVKLMSGYLYDEEREALRERARNNFGHELSSEEID